MTLPVSIPNTFANATTSIPLANLDANFTTIYAAVNGIGNGSETLANVQVSGGTLSNVTLDNVTVDVETLSNVTLVDVTVTSGNATFTTANATTIDTTNIEVTNIKAKDGTASVSIADTTGIPTISKATVIETTDNTNAALRITQLGTGNALLVEDAANPDSTPVVIDANGAVIVGYTAAVGTQNYGGLALGNTLYQQHGTAQTTTTAAIFNWSSSAASPPNLIFNKSISNIVGTRGALTATNTDLGSVTFNGDDGTNFIPAAVILGETDGTPGTNDMPGRLVFSTTADGASSPTERMRIDNAGNVGIGGAGAASTKVTVTGTLPSSSSTSRGFSNLGVAPTSSTTAYQSFFSNPSTADGITGLTALSHFSAVQGTITGGTRVAPTNQYGFISASTLTGATNNYGFYSDIASGTGRWNFYANGTADNYFAGNVGIGTSSPGSFNSASRNLVVGTGSGDQGMTIYAGTTGIGSIFFADGTSTPDQYIGQIRYSYSSDFMQFVTNDAERMRLTSDGYLRLAGGGIQFNGDTAAANALDDYEEGTWSGVVSDGTNNATMAASGNIGTYTKIGNMVNIRGYFEISSKGSISGGLRITGLPFTVASLNRNYAGTSLPYAEGLNITAGRSIGAYVEPGTSFCRLLYWDSTTGTSSLEASEINNMAFIIDISYQV